MKKQRVRLSILAAATIILCSLIGSGCFWTGSVRSRVDTPVRRRGLLEPHPSRQVCIHHRGFLCRCPSSSSAPRCRADSLRRPGEPDPGGPRRFQRHVAANRMDLALAPRGTYSVNRDCTGEAEIIIPGSPFSPVILRLVVGNNGTATRTVVSQPGYVVSSTATKVDQSK